MPVAAQLANHLLHFVLIVESSSLPGLGTPGLHFKHTLLPDQIQSILPPHSQPLPLLYHLSHLLLYQGVTFDFLLLIRIREEAGSTLLRCVR